VKLAFILLLFPCLAQAQYRPIVLSTNSPQAIMRNFDQVAIRVNRSLDKYGNDTIYGSPTFKKSVIFDGANTLNNSNTFTSSATFSSTTSTITFNGFVDIGLVSVSSTCLASVSTNTCTATCTTGTTALSCGVSLPPDRYPYELYIKNNNACYMAANSDIYAGATVSALCARIKQ